MKYLSPDVSAMKCPGKVLYKPVGGINLVHT